MQQIKKAHKLYVLFILTEFIKKEVDDFFFLIS